MVLTATRTVNPIVELAKSPFTFHQTGSRYFNTHNPDSDYDFFADYDEEIIEWLEEHNFRRLDNHLYYNDPFVRCVFRSQDVDVQLVSSAHDKMEVQKILEASGIMSVRRPKAESRMVWITAFHVFQIMRNRPQRMPWELGN